MNKNETQKDMAQQVGRQWLEDVIASYPKEAARFLKREKDQFANPVGHALRELTAAVAEEICSDGDMDAQRICENLEKFIRVRSIQDFSPSQAVSFVYQLRKVGADCYGEDLPENFNKRVDQVSLFAFDIFVKCREQFCQLRVDELKRSISALMRRMNRAGYIKETDIEKLDLDDDEQEDEDIARCLK